MRHCSRQDPASHMFCHHLEAAESQDDTPRIHSLSTLPKASCASVLPTQTSRVTECKILKQHLRFGSVSCPQDRSSRLETRQTFEEWAHSDILSNRRKLLHHSEMYDRFQL